MFDDVKLLEKMLELVRKRDVCLSSMSYDEDLGLNYIRDESGNYFPRKGMSDVGVNLTFTGHSDTVMKVLTSVNND